MVKFSKLELVHGQLKETFVREIQQSDIGKCPHVIFSPEHYRDDGTCKCNDPDEKIMAEWEYKWDAKLGRWL